MIRGVDRQSVIEKVAIGIVDIPLSVQVQPSNRRCKIK